MWAVPNEFLFISPLAKGQSFEYTDLLHFNNVESDLSKTCTQVVVKQTLPVSKYILPLHSYLKILKTDTAKMETAVQ